MFTGRLASVVHARADFLSRLALAIAQVAAIAWFSPGPGLPLDDAWIHQVVGRTFAETGTLGYTPGAHGAAATSYLWAALLAVGFKIHLLEPSRWALALNGLAALVTGQLLHSILRRARPTGIDSATWGATSAVTALLATSAPNMLWFVCSGMEAMPFVAMSLLAIWAATSEAPNGRRHALVVGFAAGALALLRPEAIPLGGLLAAHALVRKRARSFMLIAAPWIASVAIYVGSNVVKTGHVLPSTLEGRRWLWFESTAGLSRGERIFDFLDAWTTRLGSFTFDTSPAVVWVLAAIAAFGAFRLARGSSSTLREALKSGPITEDAPRLLVLWGLFHAGFYVLMLPTPGHGGRYQPLTPLLFVACLPIGCAFVLRELANIAGLATKIRFGWLAAFGIAPWILLALPIAGSLRSANALAVAHIQATEIGAGRYIDGLPEGVVASFDIGGSGYATRRPILDLGGLSDPATASLLKSGRIATWLSANRVRWVVLPQPYDTTLPTFEEYRTKLELAESSVLTLEPVRVFETPFEKWMPAIRATWNAAPRQVVYEVTYAEGRTEAPREAVVVAPDALRPIADPARLVPARERIVAEHMLATLQAWKLDVDLAVAPAAPDDATSSASSCTIVLGHWGLAIRGCANVADAELLRAAAYELAGRYLDVGDLGGALRALPHVVAQAHRRVDPSFHPSLASLMQPLPGGSFLSPARARGWGLALFFAVLVTVLALEPIGKRRDRIARFVGRPLRARLLPAAMLLLASASCARDTDVTRAIGRGRGAVEIALASGGRADGGAGRPPLLEAASSSDAEIVSLLISRGARADVRDPSGLLPLHLAARRGQSAIVAVLASAMTPELIDLAGGPRARSALHDAAAAGSIESVTVLLGAHADPNKKDSFGQTPLHLLATIDPLRAAAIASLLVNGTADPSIADARGFTPLHAAAVTDNVPLLRALSARSNLEAKTPRGEAALDLALRYGRDRAAEALLLLGATLKSDETWPPLHQAARLDAIERAAILVASGADTERRVKGKTALDLAREHDSKNVMALLRERAK
jgi:ankyrin repeat protein